MPALARISLYCFMYRPACRINHTGRTSVGRRRQASKNRLFIEAIRIVHPVFALEQRREFFLRDWAAPSGLNYSRALSEPYCQEDAAPSSQYLLYNLLIADKCQIP